MNIYVNDIVQQIHKEQSLEKVMDRMDLIRKKGIAVAVDNQVIPRNQWTNYFLKENSKIIIIGATQGG